ncbi:MAG: cellulase family glycosylhydrolase [bacterium]|nr:cellulase family glycosylhydrolase [bacterium]
MSSFALIRRTFPWIIRMMVLGWCLSLLVPAAHRAPLQPQQTVLTEQPHTCVHTNLIDEVDEWKIQRSLQLVREMGATTIVEFFPWAYIERTEDVYDWSQADKIIRHSTNQGIRVIARLGLVPGWARPGDTTLNYFPEDAFPDFAQFAVDFATRYRDSIDHIIILNEPNLAFEWGFQTPNPARYVRLLQAVYQPLHRANPDVVVLAGALAPTLEPDGSPNGLDDLIFLERMYAAGAADYFDALAIHTYGFTEPPQAAPAPDVLNFRRAELLYEIVRQYDNAATPVYITESGWNDDPRWTKAVRPSQRIAYTLDALRWVEDEWDWAETFCLWIFRYPRPTGRYPDYFTLVTPEFQLKPIYSAVQAYARGWESEGALWLPPPAE